MKNQEISFIVPSENIRKKSTAPIIENVFAGGGCVCSGNVCVGPCACTCACACACLCSCQPPTFCPGNVCTGYVPDKSINSIDIIVASYD